jgi:hypothetical protein
VLQLGHRRFFGLECLRREAPPHLHERIDTVLNGGELCPAIPAARQVVSRVLVRLAGQLAIEVGQQILV